MQNPGDRTVWRGVFKEQRGSQCGQDTEKERGRERMRKGGKEVLGPGWNFILWITEWKATRSIKQKSDRTSYTFLKSYAPCDMMNDLSGQEQRQAAAEVPVKTRVVWAQAGQWGCRADHPPAPQWDCPCCPPLG